ncbi:MAG: FAD-dependent oxidoreductase [Candidatus Sericytochromatia bacterium]|nr:FAD-dependent oxidoreductase [Candidatus Sericytochromatia bacterium]
MRKPVRLLLTALFTVMIGSPGDAREVKFASPGTEQPPGGESKTTVVVVGAGLAGLTAAYRLKQAGIDCTVLEMADRVGGRMRTITYPEGVSAEAGLEEFWNNNPTIALAEELGVPMEKSATAFSSFMYNGKLYPFTQETNEQFVASVLTGKQLSGFRAWDRHMQSLHQRLRKKPLATDLSRLMDISFADWLKSDKRLSALAVAMVRAMTEPEFGASAEAISALDGIDEWHIFAGKGLGSRHVVGGNQRLAEALRDKIGKENVLLGHQVTRIARSAHKVEVTALNTPSHQVRHFTARHVVSTMPLYRLYEVQLVPPLSPKAQEAINTQTWGAYCTAHVVLDAQASKYWHVKGADILPILTGGPLGVIYGANSGPASKFTALNLLITGEYGEQFNARTGTIDAARQEVTRALEKQWPGIARSIKYMNFVRYHPRAIASWPVGRSRFDALSETLRKPQDRLYLAGDFTEGTHSDGAAISAIRTVRQICEAEGVKPPRSLPSL